MFSNNNIIEKLRAAIEPVKLKGGEKSKTLEFTELTISDALSFQKLLSTEEDKRNKVLKKVHDSKYKASSGYGVPAPNSTFTINGIKETAMRAWRDEYGACHQLAQLGVYLALNWLKNNTNMPWKINIVSSHVTGNITSSHTFALLEINETWYVIDPWATGMKQDESRGVYTLNRSKNQYPFLGYVLSKDYTRQCMYEVTNRSEDLKKVEPLCDISQSISSSENDLPAQNSTPTPTRKPKVSNPFTAELGARVRGQNPLPVPDQVLVPGQDGQNPLPVPGQVLVPGQDGQNPLPVPGQVLVLGQDGQNPLPVPGQLLVPDQGAELPKNNVLKNELEKYIIDRWNEVFSKDRSRQIDSLANIDLNEVKLNHYKHWWGFFGGHSAKEKISAALKLIAYMDGTVPIKEITHLDFDALLKSKLGDIVTKRKNSLPLEIRQKIHKMYDEQTNRLYRVMR